MLANLVTAIRLRGKAQWRVAADCDLSPSQFSAVIAERRSADPWLRDRLVKLLNADADWLFQSVGRIPSPESGESTGELGQGDTAACAR
jgi:hypothetical protein